MDELSLINLSSTPLELVFLALFCVPILLILLAEFFYSKKGKEISHFDPENNGKYDSSLIDEKEAEKVSRKLKENAVVLGVKKPKSFKTKRKPQNTKVLTSKSVKKSTNDYLTDLVDKK